MTAGPTWTALLPLAAALLLWPPAGSLTRRRLRGLGPPVPAAGPRRPPAPRATRGEPASDGRAGIRRRRLLAASAGVAAALLVGGTWSLPTAVVIGLLAERLLARAIGEGTAAAQRRRVLSRELPAASDLMAVCLGAGVPVGGALTAVAGATVGPLAVELGRVAALYRLGAPPMSAWTEADPVLAPLGRILVRGGESGSSVVPALHALAQESRAASRADTEAAVRRAGVWLLAPLGTCFLPAFLCLGVVPLVLGIAGQVFR